MPQDSEKSMMEKNMTEKNITEKGREFIPGAMGERITYLRKQKGLTQAQVAEQLGISAQAVSKWESGLSCPDIMTLVPLAQVLEVSTDELLGVKAEVGKNETGTDRTGESETDESGTDESGTGESENDENETDESAPGTDDGETEAVIMEADTMDETGEESVDQDRKLQFLIPAARRDSCEVRRLSIKAGACVVTVKAGDEFCLETEGYLDGEVISEVEDGTWSVRDVAEKSFLIMGRNRLDKRKMNLTVPEKNFFELVKIGIGAGVFKGDGIHTKESSLNVGAGQMKIKNFYSEATKINCGMGEISIKGEIYGKCSVDCGMGSVRLVLKQPEHYGYRTSVGLGEVKIGCNRHSGIGGSQTLNPGDSNFYQISCSMGQVAVVFDE